MPLARPPIAAKMPPASVVLGAGTRLWRVHPRTWSGAEFNDVRSDPHFGGNRFDSTPDDPFHYLYAALDPQTALLETLVRSIPFDDKGKRIIRRSAVRELRITAIELRRDLKLISLLTTTDLARACQDEWLTSTQPAEYPQTRRWCQWLRSRSGCAGHDLAISPQPRQPVACALRRSDSGPSASRHSGNHHRSRQRRRRGLAQPADAALPDLGPATRAVAAQQPAEAGVTVAVRGVRGLAASAALLPPPCSIVSQC